MRSRLLADAGAIITKEDQPEWFGDLAEAQFWLHALIGRCESAQAARLEDSAQKLDDAISSMNAGRGLAKKPGDVIKALDEAVAAVSKCSQLYMSPRAAVSSDSAAVSDPANANP
jgi:HPt (histidine-containing phosphotransfer) domain-containing protein